VIQGVFSAWTFHLTVTQRPMDSMLIWTTAQNLLLAVTGISTSGIVRMGFTSIQK